MQWYWGIIWFSLKLFPTNWFPSSLPLAIQTHRKSPATRCFFGNIISCILSDSPFPRLSSIFNLQAWKGFAVFIFSPSWFFINISAQPSWDNFVFKAASMPQWSPPSHSIPTRNLPTEIFLFCLMTIFLIKGKEKLFRFYLDPPRQCFLCKTITRTTFSVIVKKSIKHFELFR